MVRVLKISFLLLMSCAVAEKPLPKSDVVVLFDEYGIPHIFAQDKEDLFFAQGYIVASLRLFQMDILRRKVEGRISEWFGEKYIAQDKLMRILSIKRSAEIAEKASEDIGLTKLIKAFTKGVNRYIEEVKTGEKKAPPQYTKLAERLGKKPEDLLEAWDVANVIAYGKWRSFELSNVGAELSVAIAKFIEREIIRGRIIIFKPVEKISIVKGFPKSRLFPLSIEETLPIPLTRGSNNWVVSGKLTETGLPMLANDPHLTLDSPSTFYLVHLISPTYEAKGATFPPIPGVLVGMSKKLCWGVTTVIADVSDIFFVDIKKDKKGYYIYTDGKKVYLEVAEEEIKVAGGEPIKFKYLYAPAYGPIVDSTVGDMDYTVLDVLLNTEGEKVSTLRLFLKSAVMNQVNGRELVEDPAKKSLLLRWTGYKPTAELAAFLGLGKSEDVFEAIRYLRFFQAGAQNFILADTKGNIAYYPHAEYPIRDWDIEEFPPYLFLDASKHFWRGNIPDDLIPRVINPDYIVTANNDVIGTTFDGNPLNERFYIAPFFDIGFRAARIKELIESNIPISLDDMMRFQNDVTSILARRFLEVARRYISPDDFTGKEKEIISSLFNWDFACLKNRPEPLYFHVFFGKFVIEILKNINIFENELLKEFAFGLFANYQVITRPLFEAFLGDEELAELLYGGDPEDEFRRALKDTAEFIRNFYDGARWQDAFSKEFKNNYLEKEFWMMPDDGTTWKKDGGLGLVNASDFQLFEYPDIATSFRQGGGPVVKFVCEITLHGPRGFFALPGGEDEDPSSKHFKDLLNLWLKGEYIEMKVPKDPGNRLIIWSR